jgi:hypothetical protein
LGHLAVRAGTESCIPWASEELITNLTITVAPSRKPDFAAICRSVKADKDLKRIALVVDFGRSAYAPKGEKVQRSFTKCVQIAKSAQGIDVLGKAVTVRGAASGLICGINGYPAKECGVEIPTPYAFKR